VLCFLDLHRSYNIHVIHFVDVQAPDVVPSASPRGGATSEEAEVGQVQTSNRSSVGEL
jgi:hypothetical protein